MGMGMGIVIVMIDRVGVWWMEWVRRDAEAW